MIELAEKHIKMVKTVTHMSIWKSKIKHVK